MRLNNVENCMYETVIALIKLTKVRDKVMLYGLLWYNAKIHGFGQFNVKYITSNVLRSGSKDLLRATDNHRNPIFGGFWQYFLREIKMADSYKLLFAVFMGFGPCTNGIIFLSGKISDVKKISHAFLDFSELENALEMRGRQMTEHFAFTRPLHDEYLNN